MREIFAPLLPLRSALLPAPKRICGADCKQPLSLWKRLRRHREATVLDDVFYCGPACIAEALVEKFSRLCNQNPLPAPPSRMPLGLLMVARGMITYTEVLAALEAQRRARYGRLGDWIEKLGFASEQNVTAALGIQWGCPVAVSLEPEAIPLSHRLPVSILETFCMMPLHYSASTNTLALVFGERLDHAALYGIERVLKCNTQPCAGGRKYILQSLERQRQQAQLHEFAFGPMNDPSEMARISASYIAKFGAEEVRLARLGAQIWLRLRAQSTVANLTFRLRNEDSRLRTAKTTSLAKLTERRGNLAHVSVQP